MKEFKRQPDIVAKYTPVIDVGVLENKQILEDDLIDPNKLSNHSIFDGYWFYMNDELYYFKVPLLAINFLNQLVGVEVTRYFGLSSVDYKLAKAIVHYHGTPCIVYGFISKYAREKDKNYTTLEKMVHGKSACIGLSDFDKNDLSILSCIDQLYSGHPIQQEFRDFIIREFFTQQSDRLDHEVLIEEQNGKTSFSYMLDYESEWIKNDGLKYFLKDYFTFNLENDTIVEQIKKDSYFMNSIEKCLDIDMLKILKTVQEKHNIRLLSYDQELMCNQEKIIKDKIKEKNLVRKLY